MTDTTQPTTGAQGAAGGPVVGQIWADVDRRSAGRTMRVESVEYDARRGAEVAVCRLLTNSDTTQQQIDKPHAWYTPVDRRGKTTRIAVERMRPTSTGYRLVSEGPACDPPEVSA